MPADDRPREKLITRGAQHLTNAELIALLIHSGTATIPAVDLARQLLNQTDNNLRNLGKLSLSELIQLQKGIGTAKGAAIIAAFELGKRYHSCISRKGDRITSSSDAYHCLLPHMPAHDQEEFHALYLNQNNQVIAHKRISAGGISETVADIRIILREAICFSASALIVGHNHPSGNRSPSQADDQVTRKIKEAAALHDIRLLDHIIVAHEQYFSYADEGKL